MRAGDDVTVGEAVTAWFWVASAGCFGSVIAIVLAAVAFFYWFHWMFDGRGM